jgi:hypothetical protein
MENVELRVGSNFAFEPMVQIGPDLAQISAHLAPLRAHHVLDALPVWRPCTEHTPPLLSRVPAF